MPCHAQRPLEPSRNTTIGPLDSRPPEDPLFRLRPQTLDFANFLSVLRYSAEVPFSPANVAVNAYLGNPIIYYAHQQYFRHGIDAFNKIADVVNEIEPDTKWESLGSVVQHMYLIRARQDQDYDVLAYSPDFLLTNPGNRRALFHVRKPENFIPGIAAIKMDGKELTYEKQKTEVAFDVPMEPGQTRHIQILYVNDLGQVQIDVSKKSLYIKLIREVSDFRDLTLSRSELGQDIIDFYYTHHLDELEIPLERLAPLLLLLVCLALAAGLAIRRRTRACMPSKKDYPSRNN